MANDKDFKIKNGLQLGGAFIEKVGTIAGNATLDLSTGNVFDYTPTADATFAFSNAGETEHSFVLSVVGVEVETPYDLANAVYSGVSFSVAAQDAAPGDVSFKPDGLKMYVVGSNLRTIYEYNLSTAWDISSASLLQSLGVISQEGVPQGLFFKPDGLKMYIVGSSGDEVNEYNLSAAWDISTASFLQNFSVAAQDTSPRELFFKPDGLKMYVVGSTGDAVYEYNLSTAWDVSSASFFQSFSVAAQELIPQGLFFKPDGLKMYVVGSIGDDVNEYNLSTAWDISTASYLQAFSVAAQDTAPAGLFLKPDGTKMYITGGSGSAVYEYNTVAVPAPATFTYPASVYWPSGTAPDAPADGETDILEFSTTDGGTVWYGLRAGDAMA